MFNKGIRDEESIRIDNVLKTLLSLVFVPKFWNLEDTSLIDNQLTSFGLTIQVLLETEQSDLIELLQRLHFNWNQQEQFADFLIAFSKENPFELNKKAIAIYQYIQSTSGTFSFGIFNKIALAKSSL